MSLPKGPDPTHRDESPSPSAHRRRVFAEERNPEPIGSEDLFPSYSYRLLELLGAVRKICEAEGTEESLRCLNRLLRRYLSAHLGFCPVPKG